MEEGKASAALFGSNTDPPNQTSTTPAVCKPRAGKTPIGVFWDIENCNIPKGKSPLALVQRIRGEFFCGHREVEFMCVCDTTKENKDIIQELNYAQVTVVHINATSKNAADDKIRQSLHRFASAYEAPATVVLISGDVNFASELSDLRYRHHHHVILLHPRTVQPALLACAHTAHVYEDLASGVADRADNTKGFEQPVELLVSGMGKGPPPFIKRKRLKQLSDNCGGKVVAVTGDQAILRFHSPGAAARAEKRLSGEDVFGNKIEVRVHEGKPLVQTKYSKNKRHQSASPRDKVRLPSDSPSPQSSNGADGGVTILEEWDVIESTAGSRLTKTRRRGKRRTKSLGRKSPKNTGRDLVARAHTAEAESSDSTDPLQASPEKVQRPRPIKAKQPSPTKPQTSPVKSAYHYPPGNVTPSKCRQYRQGSKSDSCLTPVHLYNGGMYSGDEGWGWGQNSELRDVVAKFSRDHKNSRELVYLQQQLYQEDQDHHCYNEMFSDGFHHNLGTTFHGGYTREECHSAPPLYWRGGYSSPGAAPSAPMPTSADRMPRRSPNFRRTPGASRPSSRSSFASSSGPGSFRTSPVFGGFEASSNSPHFQPIRRTPSPMLTASDLGPGEGEVEGEDLEGVGVEVMVSNLDYNISGKEWRKILYSEFHQHVQILSVYIQAQPDNTSIGFVKVPTVEDARYLISQFHRKKIGYKRIHVSLVNGESGAPANNQRSEVIALLKEVSGNKLPLFKFIELYEKRYYRGISVSELFRMKDTVEVTDIDGTGRQVILLPALTAGGSSPTSQASSEQEAVGGEEGTPLEWPVCKRHCPEDSPHYVEAMDATNLPFVQLQLRSFAAQVHTLLQSHDGSLPLMSFPACYAAEFGSLSPSSSGGVPLEHLISCVPGVKVALAPSGIKKVQWAENKAPSAIEFGRLCSSPLLNQQLTQFSRELVDLLKHSPQCRMPFSKFIPTYHHHFGKQCRVADYGYTRLMELFDALPHIVQVLGGGSRRYVTLTHRAQVKRFGTDLLRVLKSQASKQISILDFPVMYNKIVGKPFDIYDYGVCYIEDLLCELEDNTIQIIGIGKEMVLAIPRRAEQTIEETERTKQFALEVVDLLKHSPQCRMPFTKFIPSYHHHFGRQCRVSDYGFTKLLELFEAIPHVLKMVDEHDEKILCLTEPELLKVLEEQVTALLKSCLPNHELPVPEFLASYMRFHGHSLRLPDYGVSSVVELIQKVPNIAKVENRKGRLVIILVDHSRVQQLAQRVLLLLMDQSDGSMRVSELCDRYAKLFGHQLNVKHMTADLQGVVEVSSADDQGVVKLCPLQMFARDVRTLLRLNQGKLALSHFEASYAHHFGVGLVPASYGYPSVVALLQAIPHVASIRGKGQRRTLLLCQDFQGKLSYVPSGQTLNEHTDSTDEEGRPSKSRTPSDDSGIRGDEEQELIQLSHRSPSPYELLVGPVPSSVPSPDLQPAGYPHRDLIRFDPSPVQDILGGLSETEKNGQKTPLCRTPVSDMLQFAAQLLPVELPPVPASAQHVSALQEQLQADGGGSSTGVVYPPMPSAPHVDLVQQQLQAQANTAGDTSTSYLFYDAGIGHMTYSSFYNETGSASSAASSGCRPSTPQWLAHYSPNFMQQSCHSYKPPSPQHLPRPHSSLQYSQYPVNTSQTTPSSTSHNLPTVSTPPGLPSRSKPQCVDTSAREPQPYKLTSATGVDGTSSPANSCGSPSKQGTPKRNRLAAKFAVPLSPTHSDSGSIKST